MKVKSHANALRLIGAWVCILCILLVDGETPSDNVSIGFAYTLPILVSVYTGSHTAYLLAAASTLATIFGSFLEPPREGILPSFVANRVIAVVAQWLVAFLIEQRRHSHSLIQANLADERQKAEIGRRFVQILTHEVGSALTSIAGQSYRLAKLADTIAPQDIVTRSGKIRSAAARLESLVGRIRLASEVDQRDFAVRRDTIETSSFLEGLSNEFESDTRITLDVQDGGYIEGDREMLHQALSNVIGNAVKYSGPNAEVTVSTRPSDVLDGIVISVIDRGPGIRADELTRVFEPYYRGTNSGGIPGIGIGLHLVRHFIEAHGGQVRVASVLGSGTTVSVHLPTEEPIGGLSR